MYLGRRLKHFGSSRRIYNVGGAAYVLNQASVELLAGHLDDDACQAHTEKPWEDLLVRTWACACVKVGASSGVMSHRT